jgi:hypothetical protein
LKLKQWLVLGDSQRFLELRFASVHLTIPSDQETKIMAAKVQSLQSPPSPAASSGTTWHDLRQ